MLCPQAKRFTEKLKFNRSAAFSLLGLILYITFIFEEEHASDKDAKNYAEKLRRQVCRFMISFHTQSFLSELSKGFEHANVLPVSKPKMSLMKLKEFKNLKEVTAMREIHCYFMHAFLP